MANENFTSSTPFLDNLYVREKTAEHAIYYNTAYNNINDLLEELYKIDNVPYSSENDSNTNSTIDFFLKNQDNPLSDYGFLLLRNYLWKGFIFKMYDSKSFYVTLKERRLIYMSIQKLVDLKNYHSNYWYDHHALEFNSDLRTKITYLYDFASSQSTNNDPEKKELFKSHQKQVEETNYLFSRNNYITRQGEKFFLSLFLKRKEMKRFLLLTDYNEFEDKNMSAIENDICLFATHTERACIKHYYSKPLAFSNLDDESIKEINEITKLYKKVSYLNNVPLQFHDIELFPLYYKKEKVNSTTSLTTFIKEQYLLPSFELKLSQNGNKHSSDIILSSTSCDYQLQVTYKDLHKIILEIIRNPQHEGLLLNQLQKFGERRDFFAEQLQAYVLGEISHATFVEQMKDNLKPNAFLHNKVWDIINDCTFNQEIKSSSLNEVFHFIKQTPIEFTYNNLFSNQDIQPRKWNQFLLGAVQYLIAQNITPNWEWEFQSYNANQIDKTSRHKRKADSQDEFKYSSTFQSQDPTNHQLVIIENSVYVRYKDHPEYKFEINEEVMRYIILMHFSGKNIDNLLKFILKDINHIKSNVFHGEAILYNDLRALTDLSMPQHLKSIMLNKQAMELEILRTLNLKALGVISKRLKKVEDIYSRKKMLSTSEINKQILQGLKYFKQYYISGNYTPLNEYRDLSLYLGFIGRYESIAKGKNPAFKNDANKDLEGLKKKRISYVKEIMRYIPTGLKPIFRQQSTLTGLYDAVSKETIKILNQWQNDWEEINVQERIERLEKLDIDSSKIRNLKYAFVDVFKQSEVVLFQIHRDNVLKAYRYSYKAYKYTDFSKNPANTKGLSPDKYSFENYQILQRKHNPSWKEQKKQITEAIDSLFNMDALSWKMTLTAITNSENECTKSIARLLFNDESDSFTLAPIADVEISIYEGLTSSRKPYSLTARLSQISKFKRIPEETLSLLVDQLYNRFSTHEEREEAGMIYSDNMYEFPLDLVLQEQKRIRHEALLVAKLLLSKEKKIVSKIDPQYKRELVLQAEKDGVVPLIDLDSMCRYAHLKSQQIDLLKMLREHAIQGKIPKYFTYSQMIHDELVQQLLDITPDILELFERRESYFVGMNDALCV
ncbi:hypothetical protein EYV94_17745 [Puteibacter caeruleilacunae]|nr:hypothetical protein EYV94_17745 [Puteibacter caeruleilacunae]